MENKKSFGEYIQFKRKEAGFTQKSFAEKLFVTESAVSKWERGLSYPDITLVKDICEVLGISEHELMTASEDTQSRNYEKQAQKYIKITKRFKAVQFILYGVALLACFICNLAIQHTLSWFFIVLPAVLVAASLTLLPTLLQKHKGIITLGAFTVSLLLLLFVCNLFSGGSWFGITAVAVIFGLVILFLPFVLKGIWLPGPMQNHKTLLCFIIDTLLLFVLLLACSFYAPSGWFVTQALPIAAFCLILPWAFMFIIRYAKMNSFFKTSACFAITAFFTLLTNSFIHMVLGMPYTLGLHFDFANWNVVTINQNINAIIFFSLLGMALLFAITGLIVALGGKNRQNQIEQ